MRKASLILAGLLFAAPAFAGDDGSGNNDTHRIRGDASNTRPDDRGAVASTGALAQMSQDNEGEAASAADPNKPNGAGADQRDRRDRDDR